MKRVYLLILCIIMISPAVVNAAFTDVAPGHWAEGYINELTDMGIINGMGDGTFAPDGTLTKGQFLKLIITASLPGINFSDATASGEHWAKVYLTTASDYGVVSGDSITLENIDEPINRIDVVKILSLCDINIRESEQKTLNFLEFSDIQDLDVEAQTCLAHAVANGVINGYTDGTFKPENNLTRAEASKILSIYINLYDNEE